MPRGSTVGDLEALLRDQLRWIGEDPQREGLLHTPGRYLKALWELTSGYDEDPAALLHVTFQQDCDQMVVVRDIPYWSLCEHHILPFSGLVTVAYIPTDGRILGLSKLPRVVHCFARRLQVQERLTAQIADAIQTYAVPLGVGVTVTGQHTCMAMRGIRSPGLMVTNALRGVFLTDPTVRAEFLSLGAGRGT